MPKTKEKKQNVQLFLKKQFNNVEKNLIGTAKGLFF